jgi:hypothetical protein
MGIVDGDGPLTRLGKGALDFAKRTDAVGAGIGDGLLSTVTGIGKLSNRFDDAFNMPGSAARHAGVDFLQQRQRELEQTNRENPGLNATGQTTETLAEFLSGDELLKGLSMGDKFAKFSKIASALESSPLAMRAFSIGANAIRQGTVQAASTFAKTGDPLTSAAQGGFGAVASGAVESALHIPSVYRDFFSSKVVQDGLQNNIRNVLAKAATGAGIDPAITDTPSLRDAASALGNELKTRASSMYSDLDTAVGGRIQKFREGLDAVNDAIRNSIEGVDEDAPPQLTSSFQRIFGTHPGDLTDLETKRAAIVTARDAAMDKIRAAGLDPGMLDKADALYRQGSALATDVSSALRNSLSGLRPELANPVTNSAENVVASKLFPRLNKLADRGRLADALGGKDLSDALLQHLDEAHVAEQRVAARVKAA